MDKLKTAHDWYMTHGSGGKSHLASEVETAWQYADEMQKQFELRNLQVGVSDWQVDWSQVSSNMKYFAVDANGDGWFYEAQPTMGRCSWFVRGNNDNCKTPNNGYTGNWQDSLHKRPDSK